MRLYSSLGLRGDGAKHYGGYLDFYEIYFYGSTVNTSTLIILDPLAKIWIYALGIKCVPELYMNICSGMFNFYNFSVSYYNL